MNEPRRLLVLVALVASAMLGLEVLLARMYPFFLGNVSSFIAIPVAMFGLSLGALALHLDPRPPEAQRLRALVPSLAIATTTAFLLLFVLFDHGGFGLTHHKLQNPLHDALKTVVLTGIFVPPFAIAGVILSTCFHAGAERVGRLYAGDLIGSAGACVVLPILLHVSDLPVVILSLLALLYVAAAVARPDEGRRIGLLGGALLALLGIASAFGVGLVEHPDPDVLGVRYSDGHVVTEVRHRWNEVSRVALVRWEKEGEGRTWRVMHDDGVSNVRLRSWNPERVGKRDRVDPHGLPFLLDQPPKSALVIFAGAGQDMIRLVEHGGTDLQVTGVEINGLVPAIAIGYGDDAWNLQAFYDLDNVDLRIDEGRAFLDRDPNTYDLVFAAANGAQTAARTGHTRRFLDTYEAAEAELDALNEGGMLVFYAQPFDAKLEMFARLFEERGLPPLAESVISFGSRRSERSTDTLLVKPGGFTPGEVLRLTSAIADKGDVVQYAPMLRSSGDRTEIIRNAPGVLEVPTDDRPYERRLGLADFELFPAAERFDDLAFSLSWIKIFTVVLFSTASALVLGIFQARPRAGQRMPVPMLMWFGLSGVSYMLAEVGLMAKLELFLGKPLYSLAVVLAGFLLANGLGSAWVGRREAAGRPVPPVAIAVAALVVLPITLVAIEELLPSLLGLPTAAKALIATAILGPLATVLGMFYPVGVGLLAKRDLHAMVPMSFGLATLSAVVGSTFAMVEMIDVGFRAVVLQGVVGYALLAVGAGVAALRR